MTASLWMSLAEVGAEFTDPTLPRPHRDTLVRRGKAAAVEFGWRIETISGHGFIARADVERRAQGSAA